jgi:hypothetical protein
MLGRYALILVGFVLSIAPLAHGAGDERVVLVTIDGFRWQEVFGGAEDRLIDARAGGVPDVVGLKRQYWRETPEARRLVLMPFVWGTLAKQGQIFGDPSRKAQARLTNGRKFSYPGYQEILCGFPDDRIDSNDPVPNPNVSVLEWLNGRPGFAGSVAAYGTWDVLYGILNQGRSRLPIVAGFSEIKDEPLTEGQRAINALLPELPREWPDNVYDFVTARSALEHLRKHKPRVLYVAFGETDEWAHSRRYDCYLDAANRNDAFLRTLWQTLQSMPEYAGRTSLVVTTDHGRGSTEKDWTDHGKDTDGAEFVWMAVMGPNTPAMGVRENVQVTQGQVAATVAALVGEDYHAAAPNSAPPLPGAVAAPGR